MTTAIGTLCVFLVAYANLIGLVVPHKDNAVYPEPIKLIGINHYEVVRNGIVVREHIFPGVYEVGKENGYIVGVIRYGLLLPLNAPRKDFDNNLGRVKVRIDPGPHGEIANVTVGIEWAEPLSRQFFRPFDRMDIERCVYMEIPDIPEEHN